jgi:hypothetical protein
MSKTSKLFPFIKELLSESGIENWLDGKKPRMSCSDFLLG